MLRGMFPPFFRAEQHVWLDLIRAEWRYARGQANVRMKQPNFALSEGMTSTLGLWNPGTRTITLAARLLDGRYWRVLVETLRHEMAHQIVSEVFQMGDTRVHGDEFARACRLLGIPSTARATAADLAPSGECPPIVNKIRKLLALSGSSNQFEAETALRKAQELALKYDVDMGRVEGREYGYRLLDGPRKRWPRYTWQILGLCQTLHDVRSIVLRSATQGTVIEIFGTPANLDLAEYTFHYLRNTGELVWEEHLKEDGRRGSASRKTSFLEGLYSGFAEKLEKQRVEIERSTALVRLDDPRLEAYYRERHTRVTNRSLGGYDFDPDAHGAGLRAGAELRLRSGISTRGPTRGLLPD